MTPEQLTLSETMAPLARVAARLRESVADMGALLPVAPEALERLGPADGVRVDAFLKRWEQLQDGVANRGLRAILALLSENVRRMSARDAFARAATLDIIDDDGRFADMLRLRNELAREYPMSDAKRAERINSAWAFAPALLEEHDRMAAYARRLLDEGETP